MEVSAYIPCYTDGRVSTGEVRVVRLHELLSARGWPRNVGLCHKLSFAYARLACLIPPILAEPKVLSGEFARRIVPAER